MLPRSNARPAPQPQTIQPRSGAQLLPAWAPVIPFAGWTPAAAWEAAQEYADELAGRADLPPVARLEKCAYLALLVAVPGLHRADVVERLQGRRKPGPTDDTWTTYHPDPVYTPPRSHHDKPSRSPRPRRRQV